MTAAENATALLAVLNAAVAPRKVYTLDKVPSPRPANYVEIGLSRRFGGERKMSTDITPKFYRLTVRSVAQMSTNAVQDDLEKCRAALEFQRITVDGRSSTPIQFETEDPAEPDGTWFSGLLVFTYTIRD